MTARIILLAAGIVASAAGSAYAQDPALVEKGKKVYAANKCSTCHLAEGKGNKKGPLDEVGSKYTAEELHHWLVSPDDMVAKTKSTRKPKMKSYAKLPKDDLDALVAYMQTLKKK